jgi:thiol-disulfide isomerase/thioredoxin
MKGPLPDTVITGRIPVRGNASKETEKEAQSKYANSPRAVEGTAMPIPLGSLKTSTADIPTDDQVEEILAAKELAKMKEQLSQFRSQTAATVEGGNRHEIEVLQMSIATLEKAILDLQAALMADAPKDELVDEALASDPTWLTMLQEFMSLQVQLNLVEASTRSVPPGEGDRLRLLIAAKQREINQYRRRLSDQLGGERESSGLPVPTIPNAVAPRMNMPMMPNAVAPRTSSSSPMVPEASQQSALGASSTFLDSPPQPPLTDDEKAALRKVGPIRIDLYVTSGSEPCRQALDMIPKYEEAFGDLIAINPINVDNDRAAAKREGINHLPTYKLYQGDLGIQTSVGVQRIVDLEQALARVARRGTPTHVGPPKTELRYNGKTFDEWRTAWQTELSTEQRLESVRADSRITSVFGHRQGAT